MPTAQSPLNTLMDRLPGMAMEIYKTQVQNSQRIDDRLYAEKQTLLQQAYQKEEANKSRLFEEKLLKTKLSAEESRDARNLKRQEEEWAKQAARQEHANKLEEQRLTAQIDSNKAEEAYRASKSAEDFARWKITQKNNLDIARKEIAFKFSQLQSNEDARAKELAFKYDQLNMQDAQIREELSSKGEQFYAQLDQNNQQWMMDYMHEMDKYEDSKSYRDASLEGLLLQNKGMAQKLKADNFELTNSIAQKKASDIVSMFNIRDAGVNLKTSDVTTETKGFPSLFSYLADGSFTTMYGQNIDAVKTLTMNKSTLLDNWMKKNVTPEMLGATATDSKATELKQIRKSLELEFDLQFGGLVHRAMIDTEMKYGKKDRKNLENLLGDFDQFNQIWGNYKAYPSRQVEQLQTK